MVPAAVLGQPGPGAASSCGRAQCSRAASPRPSPEADPADAGPVGFLPEIPPEPEAAVIPGAGPIEFRDLDVRIRGRGEFGGDWTRFRPCDAGVQLGASPDSCPGSCPSSSSEFRWAAPSRSGSCHVDYDQTREFSATNNINVFYEGVEDEILQASRSGT